MDAIKLQDRISKGWGVAARRGGTPYTVYRPSGTSTPISSARRIIKLFASFTPINGISTGTAGYTGTFWQAIFDSHYTQVGDYLQNSESTFFVVSQLTAQPVLCIGTNTYLTVERPTHTLSGGYNGFVTGSAETIIAGWPALANLNGAKISGALPESQFGTWSAYLPVLPVPLQVADIVIDELDRRFIVAGAQRSRLGWRLSLRQNEG